MPTYDYVCKACGHAFEHFQSISDKLLRTCPECSARRLERQFGTGIGVVFKGSGFYETDYKRGPAPTGGEAGDSSSGGKGEGKGKGKGEGGSSGSEATPGSGGAEKDAPTGGKPAAGDGAQKAGDGASKTGRGASKTGDGRSGGSTRSGSGKRAGGRNKRRS